MVPLVTDGAGIDPLVLAMFTALSGMAGFVARQWIKDRDAQRAADKEQREYERAQCAESVAKLQTKLDEYESRAFKLSAIVNDPAFPVHTEVPARANAPRQPQRARTRPRGSE